MNKRDDPAKPLPVVQAEVPPKAEVPRQARSRKPPAVELGTVPTPEDAPFASLLPPKFQPEDYRRPTARQLAKLLKSPGSHAGQRIVVHGKVSREDGGSLREGFVGECTGARARLDESPSPASWQTVKFGPGSGLTWQPGVWQDELRPAAEQFAALAEGDVFQAFVCIAEPDPVVGAEDEVPKLVVERIRVYDRDADETGHPETVSKDGPGRERQALRRWLGPPGT